MKAKIFDVVFCNEIQSYEIEAFRGAIAKLVGFENKLYHNHIDKNKVQYTYPLIQYKIVKKNVGFTCIGQGVEEARAFFINNKWEISISGRTFNLVIDTFSLRNGEFDVGKGIREYKINNWMPLNQENFNKFQKLKTVLEKIDFLESILIGNILSMGKSMNWRIEDKIDLKINEVFEERYVLYKKNKVKTFDLSFHTNVILPTNIGLGKGVSHGFGILEKYKEIVKSKMI